MSKNIGEAWIEVKPSTESLNANSPWWSNRFWWEGAGERAAKTAAQAIAVFIGLGALGVIEGESTASINAFGLDWLTILGIALGGAFASLVTSVIAPEKVPVNAPNEEEKGV